MRKLFAIAAVAATLLTVSPTTRACFAASPAESATAAGPEVLVVTHSFSGNTAAVGAEIAAMLGGRFVRISDPPPIPGMKSDSAALLADVLPTIDMEGVGTLFVGFPIYDEAPSPTASTIIARLELDRVRVVPFFTYVHYVSPESLEAFAAVITERGGTPLPPIDLRRPVLAPNEEMILRTRAAILARRELWPVAEEAKTEPQCTLAAAPHSAKVCVVPTGGVWLGGTSEVAARHPADAPRLHRVEAFELDEQEISIEQYKRCVEAGKCKAREARGVSADLIAAGDHMPQPDLSWSNVANYCAFVGRRLPSEAEWVRAARGSGLAAYPWGDTPPGAHPAHANLGEKPGKGLAHYELADPDSSWTGDGTPGLAAGCHFTGGRSPFGHCDLVGNLLEWVDGNSPMAKGGSWLDVEPGFVTVEVRATTKQRDLGSYQTGGRCARSVPVDERR